jgi:hypothetical protein
MQWLQDSNVSNVNNLHNVIRQASRHIWNKKKEYLKLMNFKLTIRWNIRDLYRFINHFKKGYQPGTNIGKDEKGDLFGETYSRVGKQTFV